jgi:hypothetical protein
MLDRRKAIEEAQMRDVFRPNGTAKPEDASYHCGWADALYFVIRLPDIVEEGTNG